MLEFRGMRCTPSLPLLLSPLWPGVAAPDRVLSMGQIELNCVISLNWIVWNSLFLRSTVCKQKPVHMLNWIVCHKIGFTFKSNRWPSQLGLQNTLTPTLQKDKAHPNECPSYEVSVMQEHWRMQSTHSLPSLPGPLWPGVAAPIGSHLWVK